MTRLRLDKVHLTSLVETYINYSTLKANIVVSGSVGSLATADFSTVISYPRSKTRADVWLRNVDTNTKRPVNGSVVGAPYTFAGGETCRQLAVYSGNSITVTLSIFNGTGASISLIPQTLEASAVLYEVPISV